MQINKQEAKEQLNKLQQEVDRLSKIINSPEKDWRSVVDFDSACMFRNTNSFYLINKWQLGGLSDYQINTLKLEYCIKTINGGWKPDWKDSSEYKWYNHFEYKGSVGWVLFGVRHYLCYSLVGFGFCYQTEEKAKHGAKNFLDMYKIYLG